MFEDFLNLNYDKTPNKLRTIRELINRIDLTKMESYLLDLLSLLQRMDFIIQEDDEQLKYSPPEYRPPPPGDEDYPPKPPYPPKVPPDQQPGPTPPTPELLPDLVVKNITTQTYSNYVNIIIQVKNKGEIEAEANTLNIVIPGHSNVNLSVSSLEPNESTLLFHQYAFDPSKPETNKTIIATVDALHTIKESNETNNTKSVTFKTRESYVPSSGKGYLILHMHNPEGKEIGSILGGQTIMSAGISPSESDLTSYIAINEATHAQPIEIDVGTHTIIGIVNGIRMEQTITIAEGETIEIFFIFPRTTQTLTFDYDNSFEYTNNIYVDGPYFYQSVNESGDPWEICRFAELFASKTTLDYNIKGTYKLTPDKFNFSASIRYLLSPPTPDVFTMHLGTYLDAFNGIHYLTQIPIGPILPTTNFTYWIVQTYISGMYPIFRINGKSLMGFTGTYPLYSHATPNNHKITFVRANHYIDVIDVILGEFAALVDLSDSHWGPPYFNSLSQSFPGTSIIKISSIPYDLLDTAV